MTRISFDYLVSLCPVAVPVCLSLVVQGYSMDEASCKVLMDDNIHAQPDHKGIVNGFRYGGAGTSTCPSSLARWISSHLEEASSSVGCRGRNGCWCINKHEECDTLSTHVVVGRQLSGV